MQDKEFQELVDSLLVQSNENEWIEFKQNNSAPDTIGQYISGLANSAVLHRQERGYLLWGIEDGTKKVLGTTFQPSTVRQGGQTLEMWLSQMLRPRPHFEFVCKDFKGVPLVLLCIRPEKDQPVRFNQKSYVRVGSNLNPLDDHPGKLREFWEQAVAGSNVGWDRKPEEDASLGDLDDALTENMISVLKDIGRIPITASMQPKEILEKLGLVVKDKPTRGAILLLCRDHDRYYPGAFIKAGRFKSPTDIVDDKEFHGTLFEQIEQAIIWFRERMSRKFVIGKSTLSGGDKLSGEREEHWDYPLAALREAIANAVCHRDYAIQLPVSIRYFDDYLEISNPGRLPSDLPPEGLLQNHDSRSSNHQISQIFYNTKIIERWGTGTLRMADELQKQKQPPPIFDTSASNTFKVTMFTSGYTDAELRDMKLSDRQIQAIRYMQIHKTITNTEYQQLFSASKPTASRDLSELVKHKLIAKQGTTGKGTAYVLEDRKGLT
ncbi:MAG: putative DNA binding domain-containing protein [Cyanobacteria bacterium]|nr:putative DNA binding domain-containing protein [Cyanobacteriota bacterium]